MQSADVVRQATVLTFEAVSDLPWTDVPGWDGAVERVLWQDAERPRACAGLLALAPGRWYPRHMHLQTAHHVYVLSGSLRVGDESLVRGGYAFIPAGTEHGPEVAGSEGCTLLFVTQSP